MIRILRQKIRETGVLRANYQGVCGWIPGPKYRGPSPPPVPESRRRLWVELRWQ